MADKKSEMKDGLPLNKQKITSKENNVIVPIAALHTNWKDPRCYTKYTPFTVDLEGNMKTENYNQWIHETTWFIKDMRHLLALQYHRFWSSIVYNSSVLESLVSYMQNAVPVYLVPELDTSEKQQAFSLYLDARSYVFKVICRFTTAREKADSWIETDFFANLLYKNFIITVPLLLDIMAIYGRDNYEEVSQMVEYILSIQPKYQQDFRHGVNYLLNAFTVIQNKCESDMRNRATEASLNDLALYAHDCVYTLSVMLETSPTLRNICADVNCEFALSNFYDNTVLVLYKKIQEANESSSYLVLLNDTRVELLEAFRTIVSVQLDKILSGSGDGLLAADKFINVLTECLANNVFVSDYKRRYDTADDLQIVQMGFKSVDKVKFDFIHKAYTMKDDDLTAPMDKALSCQQSEGFDKDSEIPNAHPTHMDGNAEATESASEQQKELNVQTILELLPHIDREHARNVVDRYSNVEEAIAVLLEQSQPQEDQLRKGGQSGETEISIPNDPLDEFYLKTGIDRLNIYDGDEFDVMVNDKVKGVIKKGKGMPNEPKTLTELLDDKTHVHQMRHIYRQFDMITDAAPDDDEYDDSFDAMAESESRHVKIAKGALNVPAGDGLGDESESENDDEPAESETGRNPPLAFCENPEVVRKRREEQLHSKYLRRHGTSAPPGAKDGRTGDVRGKPKGQGQDAKVLQNRKNKNENKASVANHNRKQGASHKRNRGLLPS